MGRPWRLLAVVRGFPTRRDAERFEWRAKRREARRSRKLVLLQAEEIVDLKQDLHVIYIT